MFYPKFLTMRKGCELVERMQFPRRQVSTPVHENKIVNSNLVQYLLQTDIQKRTEKIQWQIQTLHRDFSPGNPNRENQHILY
jgi:hypothetical protein